MASEHCVENATGHVYTGNAGAVHAAYSGPRQGKGPLRVQRETHKKLAASIRRLSRKQLTRKPAPGKRPIAEILAHLAETEIVAAWRLRPILGNNGARIQPYDQNVWAETFDYIHRDSKESLGVFRVVRAGNLALLKGLPRDFGRLPRPPGTRKGISGPHRADVRRTRSEPPQVEKIAKQKS